MAKILSGIYLFKMTATSAAGILFLINDTILKKVSIMPRARTKELKRLKNITTSTNNTTKRIISIYIYIIPYYVYILS